MKRPGSQTTEREAEVRDDSVREDDRTREERRTFRALLHNCRQKGLASQARDRADLGAYLRGFASYVHMVHPDEGTEFLRQVEELLGPEADGPEETP